MGMIKTLESNLQQQQQWQQQQQQQPDALLLQQPDAQHLQQRPKPLSGHEEYHLELQKLQQALLVHLSPSGNGQQQQQQHFPVGLGSARRRSLSFGEPAPPTMAGSSNGNTELT